VALDQALSRPAAVARSLGVLARDAHRFKDKRVLLTGEPEILRTRNGEGCLLAALHLLPRICPNVVVSLPTARKEFIEQCRVTAGQIAFGPPVRIETGADTGDEFDAVLAIGSQNHARLPSTVINSNGWIARVSSAGELSHDCGQWNPVAAMAAASLGVSEVFKRLLNIQEKRGPLFPATSFSLHSYESNTSDPGPSVPDNLQIDLALFGLGAIGNGIAYLLRQLPTRGRIDCVDPQTFGEENLGTCILIGPNEIHGRTPKAKFVSELLEHQLKATPFVETIDTYRHRLGATVQYPRMILNALDNIPARHESQQIWPDVVIDGAIGQFECQVSAHPWGSNVACLQCLFRETPTSAEAVAAKASGLATDRVRQPEAVVSQADVDTAPEAKRDFLRSQIGRSVCSVINEAVARQISNEKLPEHFQPSAPFVATMSAAMVVTEMVRFIAGWPAAIEPRFQFDLLQGPSFGQRFEQCRRADCTCITRARNIDRVRAMRSHEVS